MLKRIFNYFKRLRYKCTETYRVERTTSISDMDKFQEAICAFANDLPSPRTSV